MSSVTIGIPVFDDIVGLEMTLQASARRWHSEGCKIVVVDNKPLIDDRKQLQGASRELASYCSDMGVEYVPLPTPQGTAAPRDLIFAKATTDIVVVMDSHVIPDETMVSAVRQYFDDRNHRKDILSGPMWRRALTKEHHPIPMGTHYKDEWGAEMWGRWALAWQCKCGSNDWHFHTIEQPRDTSLALEGGAIQSRVAAPRSSLTKFCEVAMGTKEVTECPMCGRELPREVPWHKHGFLLEQLGYRPRCTRHEDTQPFEIPGMGLGFFAMRREAWPGFPAGMKGFGGGELHMHILVRRNGGRAVCHPLCGWWHKFPHDIRIPKNQYNQLPPDDQLLAFIKGRQYPNDIFTKTRNYVLWRERLKMPLDDVYERLVVASKKLTDDQWQWLIADPLNHNDYSQAPGNERPAVAGLSPDSLTGEVIDAKIQAITKADIRVAPHLDDVTALAEQCEHVVTCGKRIAWDWAIMRAAKKQTALRYSTHNRAYRHANGDSIHALAAFGFDVDAAESLNVEPVACDMLILDTDHTAQRIEAELQHWTPTVKKWVLVYGTEAYGMILKPKQQPDGLLIGIKAFLRVNPMWKRVYHSAFGSGLSVLSADPRERTIDRGVGYEIHEILEEIGIFSTPDCGCRDTAREWDTWGPDVCEERIDMMAQTMRDNQTRYGWSAHIKAATGAIKTGLWRKISWTDPFPGIIREAIKRTREKDRAWERHLELLNAES